MKIVMSILFVTQLLLGSCGKNRFSPAQNSTEYTDHITVDGIDRSFIVELPDDYKLSGPLPLVFVLHGGSGTAAGMETLTSFKQLAKTEKFALVYPQGINKSWNDGRSTSAHDQGIDDLGFFSAMIDHLETILPINKKRIFVTGISNGGFMTSRLAMQLSDRFAAAAVVAATMDSGIQVPGNIRPVSMIYMHGDEDPIVPFGGGHVALGPARDGLILSHQSALNAWIAIDHCNPEPIVTDMPDISKDGTTVTRYEYRQGMQGTAVTGYTIHHGGHTWPGGWQYLPPFLVGKTTRDIQASELIWNFFKEHGR